MTIKEKLLKIQTSLKAPKGQFNSYGGFKYRSCEDILEAVKPILAEVKASVVLGDEIEQIGDRIYVKATAAFTDIEKSDSNPIFVCAYAREPKEKKGMDEAQVTGTASSYARKYALNGLFLIDDSKDPDTDEYKNETEKRAKGSAKKPRETDASVLDEYVNAEQIATLKMLLQKADITEEKFCGVYSMAVVTELPSAKYDEAVKRLEAAIKVKKGENKNV